MDTPKSFFLSSEVSDDMILHIPALVSMIYKCLRSQMGEEEITARRRILAASLDTTIGDGKEITGIVILSLCDSLLTEVATLMSLYAEKAGAKDPFADHLREIKDQ